MTTRYEWRLWAFVPGTATAPQKKAISQAIADHSGQTLAEESAMWNNATEWERADTLAPAGVDFELSVTAAMRDALEALLDTIPGVDYVRLAGTRLDDAADGEVLVHSADDKQVGTLHNRESVAATMLSKRNVRPKATPLSGVSP